MADLEAETPSSTEIPDYSYSKPVVVLTLVD